jgi:uncharacterized transporter YbjL
MVRVPTPVELEIEDDEDHELAVGIQALFFLVSPEEAAGPHLHILAQIASHVSSSGFMEEWLEADGADGLKKVLLHEDRFLSVRIGEEGPTAALPGTRVRDVDFPQEVLLVLVERSGTPLVPQAHTELRAGDRLTFLGSEEGVDELRERYGAP